jgi:hypothetical protein
VNRETPQALVARRFAWASAMLVDSDTHQRVVPRHGMRHALRISLAHLGALLDAGEQNCNGVGRRLLAKILRNLSLRREC